MNKYIITKLKKDRSERFILASNLKTWLPLSKSKNAAFLLGAEAKDIIDKLSTDEEYYYLKTNV